MRAFWATFRSRPGLWSGTPQGTTTRPSAASILNLRQARHRGRETGAGERVAEGLAAAADVDRPAERAGKPVRPAAERAAERLAVAGTAEGIAERAALPARPGAHGTAHRAAEVLILEGVGEGVAKARRADAPSLAVRHAGRPGQADAWSALVRTAKPDTSARPRNFILVIISFPFRFRGWWRLFKRRSTRCYSLHDQVRSASDTAPEKAVETITCDDSSSLWCGGQVSQQLRPEGRGVAKAHGVSRPERAVMNHRTPNWRVSEGGGRRSCPECAARCRVTPAAATTPLSCFGSYTTPPKER